MRKSVLCPQSSLAPRPGDESTASAGLLLVYDAWNRLAKVYQDNGATSGQKDSGDTLVAEYRYDGSGRRIAKTVGETTTHFFYNESWQVLETRVGTDPDPLDQYVWDPRYVDAPVVRFHDANTDGDYLDTGDNVLYYCQDANWNVTAVVSASGSVVERYMYAAYGKATVLEPDWSADADNLSDVANARLFQGEELNPETGLYSSRLRDGYHPTLGVWTSRDPAHTIDGSNVYQYCLSNPATGTDPMGLCFGTAPYVDQYEARGPAGDTGVTGATDGPQETENEYGPRLSPKEEAALRLGCELDDVKRQIANLTQKQKRLESDYYDMLDFLAEGLAQAETASKQYSQDKDDARGVGNSGAGQVRAGNEQVSNEVSRILGEKIDPVHVLEGKAVDKIGEWLFSSLGDNAFKVVKLGIEVALAANKIDLANRTGKDFVSMGQQMLSDSTSKFNNANAGFKRAEEEYRDTERQMYQVKLGYYDDSNKITAALTKAQKRNEELIQKQRDLRNND